MESIFLILKNMFFIFHGFVPCFIEEFVIKFNSFIFISIRMYEDTLKERHKSQGFDPL